MRKLTLALSAVPEVEIACVDSAERFNDNKVYLEKRAESENNLKVKRLLKKDEAFSQGLYCSCPVYSANIIQNYEKIQKKK